jgi:hypothetical protein
VSFLLPPETSWAVQTIDLKIQYSYDGSAWSDAYAGVYSNGQVGALINYTLTMKAKAGWLSSEELRFRVAIRNEAGATGYSQNVNGKYTIHINNLTGTSSGGVITLT